MNDYGAENVILFWKMELSMKESYKTISIVTPSYNQGEYLEETIRSVISQEGDFYIDYLITDGGSTDNSVDIIKKYAEFVSEGSWEKNCLGIDLTWVSEKDAGQTDAINKGFTFLFVLRILRIHLLFVLSSPAGIGCHPLIGQQHELLDEPIGFLLDLEVNPCRCTIFGQVKLHFVPFKINGATRKPFIFQDLRYFEEL